MVRVLAKYDHLAFIEAAIIERIEYLLGRRENLFGLVFFPYKSRERGEIGHLKLGCEPLFPRLLNFYIHSVEFVLETKLCVF
jgi:hypothetical protein